MSEQIAEPEAPETAVAEAPVEEPIAAVDDENDPSLADVIEVPDSSAVDGTVKLVPLAAVTKARGDLKALKAELQQAKDGSARAQQLEQRIDQLSQQVANLGPKAQAYDAALAAQQRQPEPQDDTEATEFATALDLYDREGKPDIAKARKILGVVDHRAGQVAQQQVRPLAQHTVTTQSQTMLARAKATTLPNGEKPDPGMLEAIWSRLDPALTATKEGAQQAFIAAMGYSRATAPSGTPRKADGTFAKADIPAPLHTEKAGGKDTPSVSLSEAERKYIKQEGITESEYLKSQPAWMTRR